MELEEFRKDLLEDVRSLAAAGSTFTEQAFLEKVADILIEAEEISHFDQCPFRGRGYRGKAIKIDGYSFSDAEPVACLFVVDFRGKDDVESLTQSEVEDIFGRLAGFLDAALRGKLTNEIEESSPGYGVIQELLARRTNLSRAKLYLLSDAHLSARVTSVEGSSIGGIECEYQVWDISRLHRVIESKSGHEETNIDFLATFGNGVPCIPAHQSGGACTSYLCVIPGRLLADLYGTYGSKLLEQNVRTYLQERGGINKGIRVSIQTEPEMFFAYNNGISATAAEVRTGESGKGGLEIVFARDLQIVNGGQTTASIYWAQKKYSASLDNVFVQMKLSVVPPERAEAIVPKISQYANSQNKISAADFFSNHPFHVRIEGFSRRLWAPAIGDAQYETRWFYERARGQYLNAQASLTAAEKRRFQLQHPRDQLITKTDLAKFENTCEMRPHVVSQGAQKNFARFAKVISEAWEKQPEQFNEAWFRMAVAKAIVFRTAERMVSEQPWYDGGYRANIVTYSVALLFHIVERDHLRLDLRTIWQKQAASHAAKDMIVALAKDVAAVLTNPPEGRRNVSEWAKLEACWDRVKEIEVAIPRMFISELVAPEALTSEQRNYADVQRIDDGIAAQREVLKIGGPYWSRLLAWASQSASLTPTELGIVQVGAAMPRKLPTERQSLRLMEIKRKAEADGFTTD